MAGFEAGQTVRVKAAFVRRGPEANKQVGTGQVFELDAEEDAPLLARNDLEYLLELADPDDKADNTGDDSEAVADQPPGEEVLADRISELNVDDAITFLADHEEDYDVLSASLRSERDGKDRTTLVEWLESRLAEFEDDDEES